MVQNLKTHLFFNQRKCGSSIASDEKLYTYFLLCNKKSRFDFADELKVGYVRYKHLTQITIKVQLF